MQIKSKTSVSGSIIGSNSMEVLVSYSGLTLVLTIFKISQPTIFLIYQCVFANVSTKYFILTKVYTDEGGIK